MNTNIQLNQLDDLVSARVLEWGKREHLKAAFDEFQLDFKNNSDGVNEAHCRRGEEYKEYFNIPLLVVASDCVYWECLFQPLHDTFLELIGMGAHIIVSHVKRWKRDTQFFALCKRSFTVEVLHETISYVTEKFDGSKRRRIERIYRMTSK